MEAESRFTRFKDAFWAGTSETLIIGGAGGIGSFTAFFLARAGKHNIHIYDDDSFDEVNMAGQFVQKSQIGRMKVAAVRDNCVNFCDLYIQPIGRKFISTSPPAKIMFSGFDNMEARKTMFNVWKQQFENKVDENNNPIIPSKYEYLFIDSRLLAEMYQVYYVTPDRIAQYEATLFSDAEVPNESCTFKSTTHFAAMAAAKMTQGFTAFLANKKLNDDVYELPFSYKECGPTFTNEISYE